MHNTQQSRVFSLIVILFMAILNRSSAPTHDLEAALPRQNSADTPPPSTALEIWATQSILQYYFNAAVWDSARDQNLHPSLGHDLYRVMLGSAMCGSVIGISTTSRFQRLSRFILLASFALLYAAAVISHTSGCSRAVVIISWIQFAVAVFTYFFLHIFRHENP